MNEPVYTSSGTSSKTKAERVIVIISIIALFVLGFALSGFFVVVGIVSFGDLRSLAMLIYEIPFFIGGLFLIWLAFSFFSSEFAVYEFEEKGLRVKYPFRESELIAWEDFLQVCVCYPNSYSRDGVRDNTPRIYCVKWCEKKLTPGPWSENPLKYRSILKMQYTEQIYAGIQERCPYKVIDHRNSLHGRP